MGAHSQHVYSGSVLSLVLPTFNESANIRTLIPALENLLAQTPHEIIVVDDDSPDATWREAEELAKRYPTVHVLRRIGRRGLSSAVVEGFDMAKGACLMVMDSDGQHDHSIMLALANAVENGADIAVASRYIKGGNIDKWSGPRLWMSKAATFLARKLPPVEVSDPMSGFFALKASAYRAIAAKLHPRGFKILLEILAHLPASSKAAEVPMVFGLRTKGESKMTLAVQVAFLQQIAGIAARRMRLPWLLFWGACIVILAVLLLRFWPMRALYLNASVRSQTLVVLREASAKEGWLLSDISIDAVRPGLLRVTHREHVRGRDPESCITFELPSAEPLPCSGS